ncbi:DNA helicase IV [Arcanobacterium wilhelmae]|uniref:DNA helicase IV n=1 Tax=Arcanobacterium wilhelmae TaxID=1803177 RepID=A0ABT9N980_9ACTO|nr:UvrD-helicase domain-containing protein [Arcanobacterium wilhelmae]MDP9800264.1 DNA helicase IV [Arcanobacterium wilhelmae]WFN89703.1 AAA family ATPase [Arcanobacterium wilhelmae]
MSTKEAITQEQEFVDQAYSALDSERSRYETQLARVRHQGGGGTPGARRERDSFATHYEDNLIRLRNLENRLVLGRLDLADGSTHHIGRLTLRDDAGEVLLVDWRAPQSEPFYQATALEPGNVVRRRHIQTRFRKVTGVEDELLTNGEANDFNLTGEGALFAAMNKARDGKMGDIVATIQAEQDRIIRADSRGILVVQGGPGTGKTAVALHRAAYLLYAQRERLARSGVLIIGPSDAFLHYIDAVLPSLGETDVVSSTIDRLLPGVVPTITEPESVALLKGRIEWADIAKRAVARMLEKPATADVAVMVGSHRLMLTRKLVARAQAKARATELPHNEARETYAKYLVKELAKQLAELQEIVFEDNQWLMADVAESADARREINRHWLPSSPQQLLERLLAFPEHLANVAIEFTDAERASLLRPKGSGFAPADIAIMDEMAEHLGAFESDSARHARKAKEAEARELGEYASATMKAMNLGGGIVNSAKLVDFLSEEHSGMTLAERAGADRTWTYGHVVVDEAQELSPMQWRMIARRNPQRSMTVVGDLDQYPAGPPAGGWAEVLGSMAQFTREEVLTVSYRTPAEILDRAQRAMADVGYPVRLVLAARSVPDSYDAHVVSPESLTREVNELVGSELELLNGLYGEGYGTIAVITQIGVHLAVDASDSRVSVMSAREAKGLEFDAVIVVEPSAILADGPGDLYVALTRATQHLTVVASEGLPGALQ